MRNICRLFLVDLNTNLIRTKIRLSCDPQCTLAIPRIFWYSSHRPAAERGSDESAHSRSLARVFAARIRKVNTEESKIVSEYDQKIPQSQNTDKPVAPRGRATQQSRDTRKTN